MGAPAVGGDQWPRGPPQGTPPSPGVPSDTNAANVLASAGAEACPPPTDRQGGGGGGQGQWDGAGSEGGNPAKQNSVLATRYFQIKIK